MVTLTFMDFSNFKNHRLRWGLDILILGLSLYGVSRWSGKSEHISPAKSFFITNMAIIQQSVTSVNHELSGLYNNYLANIEASKENKSLLNKVAQLENQIFEFEELVKENKRLKKLLQFGKKQVKRPILSQIVGWNSSSHFKVLRINKGFKDGIRLQSSVVTSKGLVGYIYRLTDHFADVLTILDANNKVDAIVARSRSHGILEGYEQGKILMKYVSNIEPVILNDMVLTSGLGNLYPKGVRIGRISKIERESYSVTQHIEITPSVDFGNLEEVIVLIFPDRNKKDKEWETLNRPLQIGSKN